MQKNIGLYIHFPWCKKKCPYCDFNSHPVNSVMQPQQYIDALLYDLQDLMQHYPRSINSIFMGGGTPSLFAAEYMQRLLQQIKNNYDVSTDCEITCEANPGTVDEEQFAGYFNAGINRLSIGVQSFNDAMLQKIGRIHSAERAHLAIENAYKVGFRRINIDIMYALPEQTINQALEDLQLACASRASHISWYQLTFEPETYFARFPPKRADNDTIAAIEQAGLELLAENNLQRYEISAYHKNNDGPCLHNLNYWMFGDYHAIGAGAHGKITNAGEVIRYNKLKIPKQYLNEPIKNIIKHIPPQELLFEFMLNALRLFQPINIDFAAEKTQLTSKDIYSKLEPLCKKGLIVLKNNYFQASDFGYRHLNSLMAEFL